MDGQFPFLATGLHDITADVYHADQLRPEPTLSSTLARLILNRSPLHAWTAHPRLNPAWEPTERKTFDIGRAAHRAVLGKGGDYVAYPDSILASNGAASTKEAKAWAEDVRAKGGTPLKADEVDAIGVMAARCHERLALMGIKLDPSRSELTALAEIDGVWCRAMIDNAPADPRMPLIDFKTTEDASPEACRRSVEGYGYDLQMAHYLAVWEAATGEKRDFLFVFQEKAAPFEVGIVRLLAKPGHSEDWLEDATEKAAAARQTWGQCLKSNIWPGYPAAIIEVGANPYFRQRWQDNQSRASVAKSFTQSTIDRASAWQRPEASA